MNFLWDLVKKIYFVVMMTIMLMVQLFICLAGLVLYPIAYSISTLVKMAELAIKQGYNSLDMDYSIKKKLW